MSKTIKQIIFLLTVLAMFLIAGSLDCGEMSFGAAIAASVVNFTIMAWSGFSSGLLTRADKERKGETNNGKVHKCRYF